jgi:hypothetical protein
LPAQLCWKWWSNKGPDLWGSCASFLSWMQSTNENEGCGWNLSGCLQIEKLPEPNVMTEDDDLDLKVHKYAHLVFRGFTFGSLELNSY